MGLPEADLFTFGKNENILKCLFCMVLHNIKVYPCDVKGGC